MLDDPLPINAVISRGEAAIAEAEVEVARAAKDLDKEALTEVIEIEERLKSWGADAKEAVARDLPEEKARLAAFGDELLHDFKMAREKL